MSASWEEAIGQVSQGDAHAPPPASEPLPSCASAIPPSSSPNNLGLVAGDAAGFPNGRRVDDDVVTIELRAVAGLTIPLVDPLFTPDGAVTAIQDGTSNTNTTQLAAPESAVNLNMGTLVGSYESVARMLDEVAAVEGTAGVLLVFDDFVKGVEDFGTKIQPLMASRKGV